MVEHEKRRRVLIVDDERTITDTLVMIFSQHGYETQGVYSVEQALSVMESWHTELAIIDIVLPGMNGVDLAIRFRSQWPECQIFLLSGQAATGDLRDFAMKSGHTFNILEKPVHPSELLEIVGRLLGESPILISNQN